MRAAVVQEDKSIKVQEVAKPVVQPGTLLLKTIYCSICGTDIEYVEGSISRIPGYESLTGSILGHEWVAHVDAVGDEVRGWSVGDRATRGSTKRTCGECYFCRHGLYHLCLGGLLMGSALGTQNYGKRFGAMAEYFITTPNFALPVPENVSSEEACLAEPLATGLGAVKAAAIGAGDSAVIFGAGKIGLSTVLCAKASGVAPVIVIDIIKERLDKALEIGADVVINASENNIISDVVKLTYAGPDAVIICVRGGKVLNQAVDMIRHGGTIVLAGHLSSMEVQPALWTQKQIIVRGILSGSIQDCLNLMAQKLINVMPLISKVMPLEEVQKGFDSVRNGKSIGVLLKP